MRLKIEPYIRGVEPPRRLTMPLYG